MNRPSSVLGQRTGVRGQLSTPLLLILLTVLLTCGPGVAAEPDVVRLQNRWAVLGVTMAGGGIVEFRLSGRKLNPLNWTIHGLEPVEADKPYLRGHFLCLDRWGAPSKSEAEGGVPFHGEAPRINWQLTRAPKAHDEYPYLQMGCKMPLAGLSVVRRIALSRRTSVAWVHEEVTNTRKLGRIYNMVQHPSIAAPFLSETTLVDSNATLGFSQEGQVPAGPSQGRSWPRMVIGDQLVDLRQFRSNESDGTVHDVSSFIFDSKTEIGWVTAVNPKVELLLGYTWQVKDYPWLNIWRHRENGRVKSRGLEFGTTGLHQPFRVLVGRGRILNRPLFSFIDAGESVSREYMMFVAAVPRDYSGVARLVVDEQKSQLVLFERAPGKRRIVLPFDLPMPPPSK